MASLIRAYPLQSAVMLLALLLAGVVEGFGVSAWLPLVSTVVGSQTGAEGSSAAQGSAAERMVIETLAALGIRPTIGVLLVVIVAAVTLTSVIMLFAKTRVGYTVAHVATDLRLALLRVLLVTRWEYYLRKPIGEFANAFVSEASRASFAYLCGATIITFVIQAVVYGVVALFVSWKATLAALIAGLILITALKRLVKKARDAGTRQTKLLNSSLAYLTDSLQSIKPLKAMARESRADSILERETKRLNKALRKQVSSKELLRAFQEPLLTLLIAVGLYFSLVHWQLPLATVVVLVFLLLKLLTQLNKIQREYQQLAIYESAYWSLEEKIKEAEQERETVTGSELPSLNRAIQFKAVSFAYGDHQVLQNAWLTFPAGLFTGIVGTSGAGKSTVADLVTGLLRPQQGDVWIDDLPVAEVDLRSWRRKIGYVPQETFLLHDSVLINVTLGDPDISEKDAEEALRAAGAWEFVKAMPQGMYSTVGERGGKVSGGQRQRIAIARALVHKPKLLILDEATSALDPETEAAICTTLRQLRGKLTILAISHQPALLGVVDQAYRLRDGEATLLEDRATASVELAEALTI